MNFELPYILAPALGGIIGYITNDIAIRMLFRRLVRQNTFVVFTSLLHLALFQRRKVESLKLLVV